MFNNDEDIYTLIRRANKIHLRFKQVNEILTSQVQHVVTYNLKVVNDIFKFSNKLFDKIYDSDSDSNQSAFGSLSDKPKIVKLSTEIEKVKLKTIIHKINDSKPRRNSVMPKFLKYDLMESEAPPELLISECSQGQGDSILPIRLRPQIPSTNYLISSTEDEYKFNEDSSIISLNQDVSNERISSNSFLYHPKRNPVYEDSAISEQDEEDSVSN